MILALIDFDELCPQAWLLTTWTTTSQAPSGRRHSDLCVTGLARAFLVVRPPSDGTPWQAEFPSREAPVPLKHQYPWSTSTREAPVRVKQSLLDREKIKELQCRETPNWRKTQTSWNNFVMNQDTSAVGAVTTRSMTGWEFLVVKPWLSLWKKQQL